MTLVCISLVPACPGGGGGGDSDSDASTNPTSIGSLGTDTSAGTSTTGDTGTTDEPTGGGMSDSATPGTSTGTTGPVDETTTTTTTTGTTAPVDETTTTGPLPETTEEPPQCDSVLMATVRDFRIDHPDFEDFGGDSAYKGLVQSDLGPDMKPVYANPGPTPQTSGPDAFKQWYNTTPDINLAFEIEIPLTEVEPGKYTYQNNAFFPIDDQGFGNEGNDHNFHFTTEIHTQFSYQGGEVFTFTGDDDLWLFINGKLAIDLGGLHPSLNDSIDLDASADMLGIEVGNDYTMDIFHAERHTNQSNFRIDTSILCFIVPG